MPTSAGWRAARVGRVPQARTRADDLPPLTIPFAVLCGGSHPLLGWIMGHTRVRVESGVTLIGPCPSGYFGITLMGLCPRGI